MNTLIEIFDKIRKEPFEIGKYKGAWYPTKNGYDSKKTFIYGKGYVTMGKVRKMIEPLNISQDPGKALFDFHEQYGDKVLLYALGLESENDCCNWRAISQLRSFFANPDGFFEYFDKTEKINKEIIKIIFEKWGATLRDEWIEVANKSTKGKSNVSFRRPILLRPAVSVMAYFTMKPHIDWVAYEKNVDDFILCFTPRGIWNTDEEHEAVMKDLENDSVSNKLEYITSKEIIEMINRDLQRHEKGD